MSNLVIHAKRELHIIGLSSSDDVYDGMIYKAALEIVEVFADQGHSGMTAGITIDLVKRLMNFEPLSALTDNPLDWNEVSEGMYQSRRSSDCFSHDGGKTYYKLDDTRPIGAWVRRHSPSKIRRFISQHPFLYHHKHTSKVSK